MKTLVDELGRGIYQAPRGQDPKTIVNLKRVRVPNLGEKVIHGMEAAREYATKVKSADSTETLNMTKQTSE